MNNEQKVVYPIDDLRYEIDELIKRKEFNSILREISAEFERKGLDTKSLQLLLNDEDKTASSLNDYELIAISSVAYKQLGKTKYDPSNYFGEVVLLQYDNYERKDIKIDKIVLKDFRKINDFEYRGQISYKDLREYFENNLIVYNHDTQRSPKYRSIGSVNGKSKMLKVQNVNEDTVRSIADSILKNEFEDTEIVLNCEVIEGKKQRFKFIPKYGLDFLGDIVVEVDYDQNSPSTTKVTIPDGYHRLRGILLACTEYYGETGSQLEGEIGVKFVRVNKERAKRIVYQTFLRSPDKIEWVETLKEDDYTKFVDMIVKQSKSLTIENTTEEAIANNKLTSKSLLVEVIKYTDIEVNNISSIVNTSKFIAENFDIMYNELNEKIKINPTSVACLVYVAYLSGKDYTILFNNIERVLNSENFENISRKNSSLEKAIKLSNNMVLGVGENE